MDMRHPTSYTIYRWKEKRNNYRASINDMTRTIELPQFELVGYKMNQSLGVTSTGEYSRLRVGFIFKRNMGFYVIQIYLPCSLIVVISWVSFWLSRDATPARVALGVTTVLTMTTLMTQTNSSMPKVSYMKAIDIYLGVSFVMVFASLLEYAAVGYLNKRVRRASRQKNILQKSIWSWRRRRKVVTHEDIKDKRSKIAKESTNSMEKRTLEFVKKENVANPDQEVKIQLSPADLSIPIPQQPSLSPKTEAQDSLPRPSCIDKYSRVIFPSLYFFFNVAHWWLLFGASDHRLKEHIGS